MLGRKMVLLLTSVTALATAVVSPEYSSLRAKEMVGTAAAVNVVTEALEVDGSSKKVSIGDQVLYNQRIRTSESGVAQLLFLDESTLTIGPNSEIVIDSYVYDPATNKGEIVVSMSKGLLRFVGGKISKNPDSVAINTPAVNVGIRGGIGIVSMDEDLDETNVVFLFGEEARLSNDRGTVRLRKPGWSATVSGATGVPQEAGRVQNKWLARALANLEGISPSEMASISALQIESGEISKTGSSQEPEELSGEGSGEDDGGTDVGGITDKSEKEEAIQQAAVNNVTAITGRYLATPDFGFQTPAGDIIADPVAENFIGGPVNRYNRTFTEATISNGFFSATAQFESGSGLPEGTRGDVTDQVLLPITVGTFTIGSGGTFSSGQTVTPFGPVTGSGFLSSDGQFFFYELEEVNNPGYRGFIAGGVPTENGGLISTTGFQVDHYSLGEDSRLNSSISFLDASTTGSLANVTESDFLILRQPSGTIGVNSEATKAVYTAVSINGTGSGQSSALFVSTGSMVERAGRLTLNNDSTGSLRSNGADSGARLYAQLSIFQDGQGNGFFGRNLDHFIVDSSGPIATNGESLGEAGAIPLESVAGSFDPSSIAILCGFGTGVSCEDVLEEQGDPVVDPTFDGGDSPNPPPPPPEPKPEPEIVEEPEPEPAPPPPPPGGSEPRNITPSNNNNSQNSKTVASKLFTERPEDGATSRFMDRARFAPRRATAMTGYATIGGQSRVDDQVFKPYLMASGGPDAVIVEKAPDLNGVKVRIGLGQVGEVSDIAGASFVFGDLGGTNDAYIDDQRFAAQDSLKESGTIVVSSGEGGSYEGLTYESALVTADLAEVTSVAGVQTCSCDYLTWGFWSSDVSVDGSNGDFDSRRELLHMGTFVTGDLPDPSEVAAIKGSATFQGQVVGNVINGGEQYIAAGRFTNQWNFDAREGLVTVSGFDGIDYSGAAASANARDYAGRVTSAGGFTGDLTGSFFRGGGSAAGATGGQILFSGGDGRYRAAATFAADRR